MNYAEIKGKRIILRKATAEDAQRLSHWYADGRIMVHVGFPDGLKESVDNLKSMLAIENSDNVLFILSDEFNTPIGNVIRAY